MKKCIVLLLIIIGLFSAHAQESACTLALSQVRQDSLVHFVKVLSGREAAIINGQSEVIESRFATHPGNNLAAEYLKQTVVQYGFNVQDIPFSSSGRNIIAYKNGATDSKQAYILSAHYDCVGNSTMPFQGADDNASGAAAVLEAARVLQATAFPYTIILAFWDEEENGLLGSKAFAPDGPLGFWDVKATLNLDMIGYDGNHDSLAMIHVSPVGNSVSLAAKLTELNTHYQTGLNMFVKNPGNQSTDHASFWLVGATAVGLTEDYDHDFNPNWHLWGDSIENMHLPYFTQMSKLAIAAICDISMTGKITGISDEYVSSFVLYPNPASEILTIEFTQAVNKGKLMVYDVTGSFILSTSVEGTKAFVNTGSLPAGFYVVEIVTEGGYQRSRFVKAK